MVCQYCIVIIFARYISQGLRFINQENTFVMILVMVLIRAGEPANFLAALAPAPDFFSSSGSGS